jgi:hypothetical protein
MARKREVDTKKIQYFQQIQQQKELETEIMMKGLRKQPKKQKDDDDSSDGESDEEEDDGGYVVEKTIESLTMPPRGKKSQKGKETVLKETGIFRDEDHYVQRYARDRLTEAG